MSHETSPKRKVFFWNSSNTDAIVFDPPDETTRLSDVIDATMTSKSDKAQVATVHNHLAFTDRQLYWLMLRAQEYFAELSEEDRHDLKEEFGTPKGE